jgi:hypothetical protein
MEPSYEAEEAIDRAAVVIDCTPVGNENKEKLYKHGLFVARFHQRTVLFSDAFRKDSLEADRIAYIHSISL